MAEALEGSVGAEAAQGAAAELTGAVALTGAQAEMTPQERVAPHGLGRTMLDGVRDGIFAALDAVTAHGLGHVTAPSGSDHFRPGPRVHQWQVSAGPDTTWVGNTPKNLGKFLSGNRGVRN